MARRQWNNGQVATLTKSVNPNMAEMARSSPSVDVGVRSFPLLDAINAATGQLMDNGGLGGAGGFRALPRDPRDDNAFGPMDPLTPDAIDLLDGEGHTTPRSWQYPVGWNLPGSGSRETPWQVLRAAAAGVGIIRRCIEVRKKDVRTLKFAFSPSEDAINDAYLSNPGAGRLDAEQKLRDELLPEMKRLRDFWARPWRSKSWDFQRWCNAAMEEILVIDGVPIFPNRTYGGDVYDLEIIDPTTIKPLLDVRGNTPLAPFPAYQQILYGFPRGEWAASTEQDDEGNLIIRDGFGSAEMLYYVANTRTYSPYGMSPVEMCLFDSRLYLQRQKWMIAEYDDGSTPLTWVETAAPTDGQQMTLTQQRLWEKAFNAKVAGNTRERARVKVLPNGWKAMQMTSVDERYKPEYDLYLIKLLASYFGVTATRLGFGESTGLGGSGFHEGQMEVSGELGLRPDTEILTAIINEASCKFLDMDPRVKGMFVDPAEANTAEQAQVQVGKINSGQISINEGRQRDGQSLLPFEEANMPFILGGPNGIIFLEGAKASIEAAEAQKQMAVETQALGTAGKLSLDEKKIHDGREARKEEHDFQREQTETAAQAELKKAAEIDAFRRWRRKHGDSPRRPFLFKSVEPDDGWGELDNLGPELVDYEGWEWISGEDIDKAAKRTKSAFDYLEWNVRNPTHPKGPNGRWVKRGSDLHTALVAEGERHARANAPKVEGSSSAVVGVSSSLQGMSKIQAFTIPRSETGTGREKHKVFLPDDVTGHIIRDGSKVILINESTDKPLFTGSSVADIWNQVSTHYGVPVEHEHEGTSKVTRYGNAPKPAALSPAMERALKDRASNGALEGAPSTLEALERLGMAQRGPSGLYRVTPHGAKAVSAPERVEPPLSAARARQARIDAAKAKASFLADMEEALINETESAALRRMTEQSVRRNNLADDPVAGHVQLNVDNASLNTAAAAWGLRRIGDEGSFDPAMHSPVGDRPSVGGDVELVRPGFVMRDGDEEIQIMRAVVDVRISEPEPSGRSFTPNELLEVLGFGDRRATAHHERLTRAGATSAQADEILARYGVSRDQDGPGARSVSLHSELMRERDETVAQEARAELKAKTPAILDQLVGTWGGVGSISYKPARPVVTAMRDSGWSLVMVGPSITGWEGPGGKRLNMIKGSDGKHSFQASGGGMLSYAAAKRYVESDALPAQPDPAPVIDKPLIDPASFVTSAVNAHSLRRGDMIVVDGVAASVRLHAQSGGSVAIELDDGRVLKLGLNEPIRRVHGGNLRKAADVGPGGADPKDQEPVTAPPPDQAWPGWLMDTIIASLIAQQLMAAMTGPGLAISAPLHDFLAWTQGYRPGDPMPDVNAWLRTTAPGEPLQAIVDAITPVIRDAHIEGAHVGQRAAQAVLEYVQDGGDLGVDRDPALTLSVNWGDWEPGHPEAARALLDPNGLERLLYQSNVIIRGIASNRLDQVGRILGEGLARGDAPATIGRALRELGQDPVWAHMTALTETNRAMSWAAVQSYIDAGLKYKGWMTAFDQRVCKLCDENAHEAPGVPRIVPIDMLFPSGDPWPPGHPRCRCAPIPILTMDFAKALNVAQWNVQNPKHIKDSRGRWGESAGSVIRSALAGVEKIGDLRKAFEQEAKRITGNRIANNLQGNVDTAREHMEGILRCLERFPDVRLHGVSVRTDDAGVYASAGGRWIRFNQFWTASKRARADYLTSLASGADGWNEPGRMYGEWVHTDFHVRNSHSPMSVAIHEFGHILDIDTLNERIKDDMDALIERRRVELSREIMANRADLGLETWDLSASEVIEREVSGYAKTNRKELAAEAFTDVMLNGDKASVLSRGIFDLLAAEYERWNT